MPQPPRRALWSVPALTALLLIVWPLAAQSTSSSPLAPPPNGPRHVEVGAYLLRHATVHVSPIEVKPDCDVLIRDGRIVKVGAGLGKGGGAGGGDGGGDVSDLGVAGAGEQDLTGLHLYAGFIDPYVEVDAPGPDRSAPGVHWNEKVTPQRRATAGRGVDAGTAETLRKMGFVAAGASPRGGIFRGQAGVISLARPSDDGSDERTPVYRDHAYDSVAFELFGGDGRGYPDSEMGAIALIRQTLIDADWAEGLTTAGAGSTEGKRGEGRAEYGSLRVLARGGAPLLFSVDDDLELLRVDAIARESGREAVVLGSGLEFRRLAAVAGTKRRVILPLNFPEPPKVASIGAAEGVSLKELMTWEQAPTNPRRCAAAGMEVSLTTSRLKDRGQFPERLRRAIAHGLKEDGEGGALAMLTVRPAALLGVEGELGTVEAGKRASLVVTDGPVFSKKTRVRDVWIDGRRHEITPAPAPFRGEWSVTLDPAPARAAGPGAAGPGVERPGVEGGPGAEGPGVEGTEVRLVFSGGEEAQPPTKLSIRVKRAGAGEKPKSVEAKNLRIIDEPVEGVAGGTEGKDAGRGGRVSFTFDHSAFGEEGVFTQSGVLDGGTIIGEGRRADGKAFRWSAVRATPTPPSPVAGKWKVIEADGEAKDAGAGEEGAGGAGGEGGQGLTIEISGGEGGSKEGKVTLTFASKAATPPIPSQLSPPPPAPPPPAPSPHSHPSPEGAAGKGPGKSIVIEGEEVEIDGATITFRHGLEKLGGEGKTKDEARVEGDAMTGESELPDGTKHTYRATRLPKEKDDKDEEVSEEDRAKIAAVPEKLRVPFGAYGSDEFPAARTVELRNATVWTQGPAEIIAEGSVVIRDGKIVYVGDADALLHDPGMADTLRSAVVIDATGMHITPGLIDCHSHTGISRGVNESGQAVTAEVRIGDVTDPDSINWYRELAGGLTTVNSLHGSADPIGGQNQVNKVRWGCARPDEMHFAGAIPGIKFALGENVKQSNWASGGSRYPQTRMGVETLIRDRFRAAREYAEGRESSKRQSSKAAHSDAGVTDTGAAPPRRDLELEALAEVLSGARLIHCHSYRQDEVLMLCRLAKEFGFKIGTFQHILEGYKVADEVREWSGGGSCFSDWWAYKVEVQDAIPYAGAIMHDQGVLVSFNSDSDEMARRMNTEAAKAMKYGGLSAEESLKFVTINPAKQLRIEGRVGSIEVGKDADLAVWSGPPLSTFSRCVATYVDGRELFSLERDATLRGRDATERQRLIQKLLAEGKKKDKEKGKKDGAEPGGDDPPDRPGDPAREKKPPQDLWTSGASGAGDEDAPRGLLSRSLRAYEAARRERYLGLLRRGIEPEASRCGECGCGLMDMEVAR